MTYGNTANMKWCLQVGEENPRQLLSFFQDASHAFTFYQAAKKKSIWAVVCMRLF